MTASRHRSNPRRGAATLVVIAAAVGGLVYLGVRTDGLDWLWVRQQARACCGRCRVPGGKASDTAGSQETSCVGVSMREIAESCFGIEALLDAQGPSMLDQSLHRTGHWLQRRRVHRRGRPDRTPGARPDRAFGRAECAKALNGTSGSFEIRLAHRAVGVVWVACGAPFAIAAAA